MFFNPGRQPTRTKAIASKVELLNSLNILIINILYERSVDPKTYLEPCLYLKINLPLYIFPPITSTK